MYTSTYTLTCTQPCTSHTHTPLLTIDHNHTIVTVEICKRLILPQSGTLNSCPVQSLHHGARHIHSQLLTCHAFTGCQWITGWRVLEFNCYVGKLFKLSFWISSLTEVDISCTDRAISDEPVYCVWYGVVTRQCAVEWSPAPNVYQKVTRL